MSRLSDMLARLRSTPVENDAPSCDIDPELVVRAIEQHEERARLLISQMSEQQQKKLRVRYARAQAIRDQRDFAVKDTEWEWWPG